jgi:hypothetical protein
MILTIATSVTVVATMAVVMKTEVKITRMVNIFEGGDGCRRHREGN